MSTTRIIRSMLALLAMTVFTAALISPRGATPAAVSLSAPGR